MSAWRCLFAGLAAVLAGGACFSERATPTAADEVGCDGSIPAGVVRIRDFAFQPAEIRVRAGSQLTWVNCDSEAHSATADGYAWDSGLLSPNTTFTRSFEAGGTSAYHCEPHPFMRAAVVVE